MEKFLEENAHAPDGKQPILTRETMVYAISLSISCVCLHANDDILKGRASAAYKRAMSNLESMSDATWHSLPSRTSSSGTSRSSPTLKVLHRQPQR